MSPVPFEVESEELGDGIRVFTVRGELDMGTASELEQKIEDALTDSDASIVLDLCECEFIDSTGIALLVATHHRLNGEDRPNGDGGCFRLVGSQGRAVRRVMEVTGLDTGLPFIQATRP